LALANAVCGTATTARPPHNPVTTTTPSRRRRANRERETPRRKKMYPPPISLRLAMIALVLSERLLGATCLGTSPPGSTGTNDPQQLQNQIRNAIELTTLSTTTDPSLLSSATSAWDELLSEPRRRQQQQQQRHRIVPSVLTLCHTLHGHTLSRAGRDRDALKSYDEALKISSSNDDDDEALTGRANALRRLFRYDDAASAYRAAGDVEGEITCLLRQGLLRRALKTASEEDGVGAAAGGSGFAVVLKWMMSSSSSSSNGGGGGGITANSVTTEGLSRHRRSSLLYEWLYRVATRRSTASTPAFVPSSVVSSKDGGSGTFLSLVSINHSAFDVPHYLILDDKIRLHRLLTHPLNNERTVTFWPRGFVLPEEKEAFRRYRDDNPRKGFIVKDPAGYGSHGNRIYRRDDDDDTFLGEREQSVLCQELILPSSSRRHGTNRQFSLRVYVVTFYDARGDLRVYVARNGLVKYASTPRNDDDDNSNNDISSIATNSAQYGNEDNQIDWDVWKTRKDCVDDFEGLWEDLKSIVRVVMTCRHPGEEGDAAYWHECRMEDATASRHFGPLHIPKIMGWDVLLDGTSDGEQQRPMLIEVNRFPGLEPRGGQDDNVKRQVVGDAWRVVAKEIGLDPRVVGLPFNYDDEKKNCLEELNLG